MTKKNGFTLIDLIVAVGVFAVISAPVFYVFSSSNRTMQMTDAEYAASNAAIEILEQTASLPFTFLKAGVYSKDQVKDDKPFGSSGIKFRRMAKNDAQLIIEDVSKNGKVILKRLTVTADIIAPDGKSTNKHVILKTVVADETF